MKDINVRYVFDRVNATGHKKKEENKIYKEDGLLQIEVRQLNSSRKTYISTGIKLKPEQFSKENGFTCKKHTFALKITAAGRDIFNGIFDFATSDKCKTLKDVHNWNKQERNQESFINFYKELKNEKALTLSFNTMKHHNTLLERIINFALIKSFDDLTYENIMKFDATLKKEKKLGQTSIYKNHSVLRSYIQEAVNRDYIKHSPYNRFQPKKGKGEETVFLTEAEINNIQELDFNKNTDNKLQKVKDLFLFQCFTGLAYVDTFDFNKEKVLKINNHNAIRGFRQKTKEQYVIFLLPEAEAILKKYDYSLPTITNQKYNDYLKLIAIHAKINKNITTHVGRHTFATYLLNKGVSIESVASQMGHSDIKQTQVYARMLTSTPINEMAKLFKKTKPKSKK